MKMQDLTGKVALITGASSGIGAATASLLASEGVQVILAARRIDAIEMLASELGNGSIAIACDITDRSQVAALFSEIKNRFGGLDLLFNNAGLGIFSPFVESQPDDWRTMVETNVLGLMDCTAAALPLMSGRTGAMIASVSSTGGRYGVEGWSVYCATKYAVVGFHEALRKEVGAEGIRITLIEPGAVWTEFGHNVSKTDLDSRRESLDALTPEDVAQSLVYAFAQHPRVLVQEILVRPVKQLAP
ncbi:SDR family oxidoreductase [Tatumella citrea]|uniref:Oxidoreductase n=1 Tax=Tatumella citrea TaxID=53336 RepID=A0A1Y0L7N5_TATCI|nr:SDR family oxidoreductase [Tatumella citrea]ARU93775.1 oxidoreductase [Tatumella citrea]ARU97813.1 oxidoreductase [Tatumella citrea]